VVSSKPQDNKITPLNVPGIAAGAAGDRHATQLQASGISPEVAKARGYRSLIGQHRDVTGERSAHEDLEYLKSLGIKVGKDRIPGLLIPWWNTEGSQTWHQYRPDNPGTNSRGKPVKYVNPTGKGAILDVHPHMQEHVADPAVSLFITEGIKKADAATTCGLCCIALVGVDNWQRNGEPLPDWFNVALADRDVYIAFDSDQMTKPGVKRALRRLRRFLESQGARVHVLALPGGEGDAKVGLDDYLAGHTVEQLLALEVDEPDPEWLADDGSFNPVLLGRQLKKQAHLRLGEDQRLWRYVNGVYRPDGDKWVEAQARELLDEDYRPNRASATLAWCRAELTSLRVSDDLRFINVQNGLLDWRTGTLHPHSPDVASMVQLPVEYHPEAKCPTVGAFLRQVLPKDAHWSALEIAGLLLIPEPKYRKAMMLLGDGDNGKSTFLHLVRSLLGNENVTHHPLQAFGDSRFSAADLYGRLANICGDLDARALRRGDLFKVIVGGSDRINAEFKFGQTFSFVPRARLVFSANEAPATADQTPAYFGRWVVVPFPNKFVKGENMDEDLPQKLTAPEELSGFLNLALKGLRRLTARGYFEESASMRQAGASYRAKADTVAGFVRDCCVVAPDEVVGRSYLHKVYTQWCKNSNRHPISAQRFNDHLPTLAPVEVFKSGVEKWRGIGLAPDADTPSVYFVSP